MSASAAVVVPPAAAAPDDTVVTVTGGPISGRHANGIVEYLGVPFAAPTSGENRFAPPQPVAPWTGVPATHAHGPQCPQASPAPFGLAVQESSEDCLSIDIYVPENSAGAVLPVMVWIYGGAFVLGSNAQYDSPDRLVREDKVIVAIPNYRVGPFGFLALPELADSTGGITGTYGTLDQQAALRWIQENAAAFGGDPGNVTLFGESAGGMSVCTQLASPLARGLFHRAIIQSGSCARSPLSPPDSELAFQRSADYAASLGCRDPHTRLNCLRALPVGKLLDSPSAELHSMAVAWSPVQDGVVLTSAPEQALAAGAARDMPLLVGSNADEGATFIALLDYLKGMIPDESDYLAWAQELFGDNAARFCANTRQSISPPRSRRRRRCSPTDSSRAQHCSLPRPRVPVGPRSGNTASTKRRSVRTRCFPAPFTRPNFLTCSPSCSASRSRFPRQATSSPAASSRAGHVSPTPAIR
ncbi:carboxylesterase family protein [Rhodococcus pyridinivorans]|nr:carboxylesterase family protein [Rhodococcus pyridinivorans]